MRYMLTRFYDSGLVEMQELSQADIQNEGLALGCTEDETFDTWIDEFDNDDEFEETWLKNKAEGAKVVLA